MVAAVSAALCYDYFLTTPYNSLVIDSLAQVITVALLVATGIMVSIGGRVRRRSAPRPGRTQARSGCYTGSPRRLPQVVPLSG
jgi:K+-sensing histidine kinase KdpD